MNDSNQGQPKHDSAQAAEAEVRALGQELRNWGRWGEDDQRGTVNFITPAKLVEAGRMICRGKIFSLAHDLGPNPALEQYLAAAGRFPALHRMTRYKGDNAHGTYWGPFRSSDDMAVIPLQGSTQWDSLAHLWYDDQLYNGYPADSITAAGASKNAISNLVNGVVSRGVLIDVPRAKGLPWLPDDYAIAPEDLDAALMAQGVQVTPGDVVLVRTGLMARYQSDLKPFNTNQPGLSLECARWLHSHQVAAVCADNVAVEVLSHPRGLPTMAFHMVALRDMGLLLGEVFVLEALAEDCARDRAYDFLFAAPPLNFPMAVGSPINPLAIK